MDEDRSYSQPWVRRGLLALQFILGLTVLGLYMAPARAGSVRCAYAVTVAVFSVLTVVGDCCCRGGRILLFVWETILV